MNIKKNVNKLWKNEDNEPRAEVMSAGTIAACLLAAFFYGKTKGQNLSVYVYQDEDDTPVYHTKKR